MQRKIIPTYYAKSLFEVDIDFFKSKGIKYILTDLDNTLDSYLQKTPTPRVVEYVSKLNKEGIELIIISNNKGPRVTLYANTLKVKFLSNAGKPFKYGLNKYLATNKMAKNEVIMVGDQLMTDIKCGNNCHIKTLLTDPICDEDQWQTRFNRMFDRPLRKKLHKKNLLKYWR